MNTASPKAILIADRLLKYHEGWRLTAYADTLGKATVGCGHLLKAGEGKVGDVFTEAQCQRWFNKDLSVAVADFKKLQLPAMSDNRQAVILDMLFALGWGKFNEFKNLINYLRRELWSLAALEISNSQWAKQVHNRAKELEGIMRDDSLSVLPKSVLAQL